MPQPELLEAFSNPYPGRDYEVHGTSRDAQTARTERLARVGVLERVRLHSLQPTDDPTDVEAVVRGVLEAEEGAIAEYRRLIEATDGVDWVTQDMVIAILRDEQRHRRLFEGFLREFESA